MALKTPKEVSETLKVKVRAVYLMVRQRRIRALRIGKQIRILDEDLDQFIAEQRERGAG